MPAFAELPEQGPLPSYMEPRYLAKDISNFFARKSETVPATIERKYGDPKQKVEAMLVSWESDPTRLAKDIDTDLYLLDILPDRMQLLFPDQDHIDEFRAAYQTFITDLSVAVEGEVTAGRMSLKSKKASNLDEDDLAGTIASCDNLELELNSHPIPLQVLAKHTQALVRIVEDVAYKARSAPLELRNQIVGELSALYLNSLAFDELVQHQTRPARWSTDDLDWYKQESQQAEAINSLTVAEPEKPDPEILKIAERRRNQKHLLAENKTRLEIADTLESGREAIQKAMVTELMKQREAQHLKLPSQDAVESATDYFLADVVTLDRAGVLDKEAYDYLPVAKKLDHHPRIQKWLDETNSIVIPDSVTREDKLAKLEKMEPSEKAAFILELGPNSKNIAVLEQTLKRSQKDSHLRTEQIARITGMLCYADLYLSLHPEAYMQDKQYPDTRVLRSLQNLDMFMENSPGVMSKKFNQNEINRGVHLRTNIIFSSLEEMIGGKESVMFQPEGAEKPHTVEILDNHDLTLVGESTFEPTGDTSEVPEYLLEPNNFTGQDILSFASPMSYPRPEGVTKPTRKPRDPMILERISSLAGAI